MSAPPPSTKDGVSVQASPLLIGSGIAAVLSTVLLAVMWRLDSTMPPPPPSGSGSPPPPPSSDADAGLFVATGLFTIAWIAVVAALCRDQIVRRINAAVDQLQRSAFDFGEHRYNEGYLSALNQTDPRDDPGGGGDVLPFPRPVDPDER